MTPRDATRIEGVTRLRFEAPDGLRGVWPGHEPASFVLRGGVVRLDHAPGGRAPTSYLATEGGFLEVRAGEVQVVSRWAAAHTELEALVAFLRQRRARRQGVDEEARRLFERHELATRKALAGLQREVHR